MRPISVKTQLIIFLAGFAIFLSLKDRDMLFLLTVLIAMLTAAGADSIAAYLKDKRITLSESSVISGLIIGYVLSSGQPWWIFVLASTLAIASKHLIRFNKKHLFNPAAFGIFSSIILFGAEAQWKGTYLWYILLPAGLYFICKIRKLEVLIGYGLAALGVFGIQAIIQKSPILNIFGYLSYFYIFVMIIEPKTTPARPLGKFIFGMGVAVLIFILTESGVKFDPELSSLLALNLVAPILNKLPDKEGARL